MKQKFVIASVRFIRLAIFLLLISLSENLLAATPAIAVGSVTGTAGSAVDLPVTFSAGSTVVSTLQFDLTFPSALSYVSITTGSAAITAGKSASGSVVPGGVRVLIFGLNQTGIGSGSIAIVRLNIASGTVAGALTAGITGIAASSPSGIAVSTSGSGGTVTVTVSAPADTTAPVISSVGASSVTTSGATISWSTNEASDSQVEYGTKRSYGNSTALASSKVTAHLVSLSGLQASTLYHYRVKSRDAAGNLATSPDATFTTAGGADTTAPVISGVGASSITTSGATIFWTTNEASDSQVVYGTKRNYINSTALASSKITAHSAYLSGLEASTLYHYRVKSRDMAGNLATSPDVTFTTPAGLSSKEVKQPAKLSTGAIFVPSIVENSRFRTNLGINNLSAAEAHVNLTLVDAEGMVLASKTLQVGAKGLLQTNSVARFIWENSLGNDIQGSLYLESDQLICALASQIENTTNDPSLLLSHSTGSTKILIPSGANNATFSSSLAIMNNGSTSAQVSLKAYSVNGVVLGQTPAPLSIVPNGVLTFENILQTLGVTNNYGPIEITSLNDVPLIATSRVSSGTGMGGFFEGLKYSDASVTQVVPNVVDTAELRTNLGINNVTDQMATVTVHLINQDGVEMGTTPVMVAPKGLTQVNNVARQLLNQSGASGFEGYIRLESNEPILGWASIIDNVTNDPGFVIGRGKGAARLLLRSTANLGNFKSSLVIVNMNDSPAIVDIVSRDVTGQINGEYRSLAVPARGSFSFDNILERLGVSNNFGPVEITSTNGTSIIAVSRVYNTTGASGFLEGEEVE